MKDKVLDFLKFRMLITHQIVKILFWISTVLSILAVPIISLVMLVDSGFVMSLIYFIVTTILVALAILLSRIFAELIIVIFGIHDELKAANDREDSKLSEVE